MSAHISIARRALLKGLSAIGLAAGAAGTAVAAQPPRSLPKNHAFFEGKLIDLDDTDHREDGRFLVSRPGDLPSTSSMFIAIVLASPEARFPENYWSGRDGFIMDPDAPEGTKIAHIQIIGRVIEGGLA